MLRDEGNLHQSNRSDLQQNIYELLYSTLPSIAGTHFSLSTPSVLRPYIYFCATKKKHMRKISSMKSEN